MAAGNPAWALWVCVVSMLFPAEGLGVRFFSSVERDIIVTGIGSFFKVKKKKGGGAHCL